MQADPKRVVTWLLLILVPVVAGIALAGILVYVSPGTLIQIIEKHFAATIGLPMAALAAAFLVIGLSHSGGPVRFEGLGFRFEGTSGEIILWIACFLAITAAIKLLWSAE